MIERPLTESDLADIGPRVREALRWLAPGKMLTIAGPGGRGIRFAVVCGADLDAYFERTERERLQDAPRELLDRIRQIDETLERNRKRREEDGCKSRPAFPRTT